MSRSIDFAALQARLVAELPGYERSRTAIQAYLEKVEGATLLFTWAPVVDGHALHLVPIVEQRCCAAVASELRKCLAEIDAHIQRVTQLQEGGGA